MRIMVTGGQGFLGSHICNLLELENKEYDDVPHSECDLLSFDETMKRINKFKPDSIIHLCAFSGNISFGQKYPADTFWKTTQIGLNVLRAAHYCGIDRVVSVISSCAYPSIEEDEIYPEDFWEGPPHESIECHGLAKRNLFAFSKQLHKQFKRNYVCCVLNNLYGENDSVSLEKTKSVMSLIKKFVDAKNSGTDVVLWGDGSPLRQFTYAGNAARAVLDVLDTYNDPTDIINVGGGTELTIMELAEKLRKMTGFNGNVIWDRDKPNGQLRKALRFHLDYVVEDNFDDQLQSTIDWYVFNYG